MLVSWIILGIIDSSEADPVASTWSPTILKADCMCPPAAAPGRPGPGGVILARGTPPAPPEELYPGAGAADEAAAPDVEDTEWCLYAW